jgi:hypothetical protein
MKQPPGGNTFNKILKLLKQEAVTVFKSENSTH